MKIIKTIKYISLAMLFIAIGYFFMMYISARMPKKESATISNETSKGEVLGETGTETNNYTSENFRVPQITFGGDAITIPSGQESVKPEILDLRSEMLATKRDQQIKFLVSWKTNKPCVSAITYSNEGGANEKNISEDSYGYIHSAEISPLNFSTSYKYSISIKDKWGNEIQSDKLAFYTGAPNVSIFDLIGGAFKDMFGWAGRR